MLDRLEIVERFPWLVVENLPMVVSNDLDGFCSAVFMHHLKNWQIAGFYDSESVWFASEGRTMKDELEKSVWLDLDIVDSRCRSLGHHILTQNSDDIPAGFSNSFNPNLEMKISRTDFTKKYPFSTFVLLLWLFQFEKPISETAKALFLHSDSVWINAQYYQENIKRWLEWMPFPILERAIKNVDSAAFEQNMQTFLFSKFDAIQWDRKSGQKRSKHLKLETSQLQMNPDWDMSEMRNLLKFIAGAFSWKLPKIPKNFLKIKGKRISAKTETVLRRHKTLSDWVIKEKVFSYALPSFRTINFTKGFKQI